MPSLGTKIPSMEGLLFGIGVILVNGKISFTLATLIPYELLPIVNSKISSSFVPLSNKILVSIRSLHILLF